MVTGDEDDAHADVSEEAVADGNEFKREHKAVAAFIEAAANGNHEYIVANGNEAYVDGGIRTRAFKKACEFGHVPIVEHLLRQDGVVPHAQFNWSIRVASANNHVALVDRLLTVPSVDATARQNWALVRAAERGHSDVVQRLLRVPGIDPGARNNWSIIKAAENGHAKVVEMLLEVDGVDPTALDNEALKSAIRLGWDSVVALLLDDDRVRRTIKDFGALIDVAGRASVRRKLTRAMRESTVKAIVLVARSDIPVPNELRMRILLLSHGLWLNGANDQDNLLTIKRIMRRGKLGR
ncbi:Ankyrin repeat domain-containing protein [Plasmodiophora brassicae]